jgi:hypothetical protein
VLTVSILALTERNDQLLTFLPHRLGLSVQGQAGDLGLRRQSNQKVLGETAAERQVQFGNPLALAEVHFVGNAIDRLGRARDRLRTADAQGHGFPRPGLPHRDEVRVARLKERDQTRQCDIPNRRRHQLPSLHPEIIGAGHERQGVRQRKTALPRKVGFLGAQSNLDQAIPDHRISGHDILPGNERKAQRDRLPRRR